MKIVVLAGGRSTERNVSLSSGAKITDALRSKGHQVVMVDSFLGIDLDGVKNIDDLFTQNQDVKGDYDISDDILTDEAINALRHDNTRGLFGKNVLKVAQAADMVYMGLHGEDGENGKVQAVLDLNDIKYTGSDTLAAGIAMNKSITKQLLMYNHINTARFVEIKKNQPIPELPFGYPVVVKPTSGGSSVGVTIVHDADELKSALADAYHFDNSVLVEEYIGGREFSLGIVNGKAMPAIEIVVNNNGWYDFKHKFQPNTETQFITPPDIPDDIHHKMQEMALKTMDVIGLTNYCRIDFFLKDGELYVIEANTLPGMTPQSLLPQEAAAAGINYADLVESIVEGKMKLYNEQ